MPKGVPFFRSKEIGDLSNGRPINTELFISPEHYEKIKETVGVPEQGDILLTSVGTIGNSWIVDDRAFYFKDGNITQISKSDVCASNYLVLWIESSLFSGQVDSCVTGTAYHALTIVKLSNFILPIPPLTEQHRIVAKINELMPLVEEYGRLEDAREALDASLPDRLRNSVLQLAVEGKLVEQDPTDEPASVLLDRIHEERAKLIKEKKIKAPKGGESVIYRGPNSSYYEKRGKGEAVCIDDEISFEIPESWEWARLDSLGEIIGGGTPKTGDASLWSDGGAGYPWLTPADMKFIKGKYASRGERNISAKGLSCSSARLMPKGTVLMSSRAPVGYLAIAENDISTNQGFKSVVPQETAINLWLFCALEARMDDIRRRATGTTFKEISGSEFGLTVVPIPPMAEQRRIVDKVDELMTLIGKKQ